MLFTNLEMQTCFINIPGDDKPKPMNSKDNILSSSVQTKVQTLDNGETGAATPALTMELKNGLEKHISDEMKCAESDSSDSDGKTLPHEEPNEEDSFKNMDVRC